MTNLKICGRVFYGIGIAGIGIMHFFYPGFRPIIFPIPAAATTNISFLIYAFAIGLMASGLFIALGKYVKPISLVVGYVFLLFLLFGHLPNRLKFHPEILAYWTDAIKILALSGGAFVISSGFPNNTASKFFDKLAKIDPVGRYLFASMLFIFGIGHLVHANSISGIVPKYIPWPIFLTYFSGIALTGAGIAIFINFKIKYIGLLLALMLFLWFISLHLYYAFRFPNWRDGENIIGSFECLAFCGTALLVSQYKTVKSK